MRIIISIITLGLLLTGCSQSPTGYNQALLRAEGLIESRPDSALNILDSISKSSLQSESDNALYALLMVQARVKNRIDDGNDSLINAAVDYYSATDDSRRKMLAYYNRGFLQLLTDSLSQAVSSLLTALDLAEETDYNFYASLACRELSLIFRKTGNTAEELSYADKAFDYIQKDGRQPHADWAMIDLAGAYHHIGEYEKSNDIYRQLIDTLKIRPDSALLCATWRNLSRALIADGKSLEALPYLEKLSSSGRMKKDEYALLGLCLVRNGDIQGAKKMLERADSVSALTNWLRYSISIGTGDKNMALESLSAMQEDSENDIRAMMHQRATYSALIHHEQQKLEAREGTKIERMHTVIAILICCLIIIIAIGVIINLRMRQHADNERNERAAQRLQQKLALLALEKDASQQSEATIKSLLEQTLHENADIKDEADRLREALICSQARVKELNESNQRCANYRQLLYKQTLEHNHIIGKICSVIYASDPDKKVSTTQIASWLDKLVKDISNSPNKFADLETIANMTYDNVMKELRSSGIDFKEDDYKVYLLSILGLSPTPIAKLMKADKPQQVYSRKKRIIAKLSNSSNPLATRFLNLINGMK